MKTKLFIAVIWGVLAMPGLPLGAADYFNPADYQYNMTITGTLLIADIEISGQDTLFAYAGEQCCGFISPKFESGYGQWFVYLVVHGHGTSEEIKFRYYDETKNEMINLHNSVIFEIDKIMGSPGNPYLFSDVAQSVQGNLPAAWATVRQFGNLMAIDIREKACFEVIDLTGKIVLSLNLREGRTEISLNGYRKNVYFLRIYNTNNSLTKKVIF